MRRLGKARDWPRPPAMISRVQNGRIAVAVLHAIAESPAPATSYDSYKSWR